MLQKENRLIKIRDFNLLMKNGRWVRGSFLDVRFSWLDKIPRDVMPKQLEQEQFLKQTKIACTVGLKIDKRAVVRNRIRRQMREVVRLLIKDGRLKTGRYVLITARKEVLGKHYKDIAQEIEKILKMANILS